MSDLSERIDVLETAVKALANVQLVGDLPGHPFRGNQWTMGSSEKDEAAGLADGRAWLYPGLDAYGAIRTYDLKGLGGDHACEQPLTKARNQ